MQLSQRQQLRQDRDQRYTAWRHRKLLAGPNHRFSHNTRGQWDYLRRHMYADLVRTSLSLHLSQPSSHGLRHDNRMLVTWLQNSRRHNRRMFHNKVGIRQCRMPSVRNPMTELLIMQAVSPPALQWIGRDVKIPTQELPEASRPHSPPLEKLRGIRDWP